MLYKNMSKQHRINLLKKVIREENHFHEEESYWKKHLSHRVFQVYSALSEAELYNIYMYFLAEYESAQLNPVEFENTWAIENGY